MTDVIIFTISLKNNDKWEAFIETLKQINIKFPDVIFKLYDCPTVEVKCSSVEEYKLFTSTFYNIYKQYCIAYKSE